MKNINPSKLIQQVIDFQKTTFDNSYNAMLMMQGQMEKMTESIFSKNSLLPEEGQKMIQEWMLAIKNKQDEFKKTVDENFKKLETLILDFTAKAEKTDSKSAK